MSYISVNIDIDEVVFKHGEALLEEIDNDLIAEYLEGEGFMFKKPVLEKDINELKEELCDRYGISHLSDWETILNKLNKEVS